ncbi:hypothetical protein BGX28_006413 [Mortierella sp. GBA30]|nr:hypothetical protein BGX28_006413 [Mortierella sp. GBA30]
MSEAVPPSAATATATTLTNQGSVGGHLTKKQRKEQFEALNALQTQLDVSVSLARSKVASWLNADTFSDDEDSTASSSNSFSGGFVASSAAIKPRQPGLGLGAKFISHKDQMRHIPMNAFESKLKRQLTGGIVAADAQRAELADKNALPDKYQEHKMMMAARRKELQKQAEDEEDSRTRNIGGTIKVAGASIQKHLQQGQQNSPKNITSTASGIGTHGKQKQQGTKYQAAVHPAALKAASTDLSTHSASSPKDSAKGGMKKRPTDFFSTYMDERANKMAKKKKKAQGRANPDDD